MLLRIVLGLLLTALPSLLAREATLSCGTHALTSREELFLHRQSVRLRKTLVRDAVSAAALPDVGEIARLSDENGVIARRNVFTLSGRTLMWTPSTPTASRYRLAATGTPYDPIQAVSGAAASGLGDDDTRRFPLSFPFPFFGTSYRTLFVNSDGNMTFNTGDGATADRSLARLTSGAPRIAGLLADLDPSGNTTPVRVLSAPDRFVVSWAAVPTFDRRATVSFQIRLFPDGRIECAYGNFVVTDAVVGISPGSNQGVPNLLSLVGGSGEEFSATIAERFSANDAIDIITASQQFYRTHEDAYDYLVFYNATGTSAGAGVVAYETTVQSIGTGYGDDPTDLRREFGSPQRLRAVLNMGPLSQYPADPDGIVRARGNVGDTPLTVLGHEAGHLFLALASVRDPRDAQARPMLDDTLVHWSFNFNSEASLLQGNRIRDNGAGSSPRFATTATVEGYAPLDQYLMGFRPPEEVPATFLVQNSSQSQNRLPEANVSLSGSRRDIAVSELIAAEGPRLPDATVAQRRFRFAFVLITAAGQEPTSAQLAQIDAYRTRFEQAFARFSDNRASADTGLRRAVQVSLAPAAGVLVNRTTPATLTLRQPAATDVTFTIGNRQGIAATPATVVIPAGKLSATFAVQGVQPGVAELSFTPADQQYEAVAARVQVLADPNGLTLSVLSGDGQDTTPGQPLAPVILAVRDRNGLPYAGVPVQATVTSGGSLAPNSGVTDSNGTISLQWTPGTGSINQLQALISVSGYSHPPVLVATASGASLRISSVVNGASFQPGLAPGAITTIFGSNLGVAEAVAASGLPLPTVLGGASVLVNSIPATLYFASPTQINVVLPNELAAGVARLEVLPASGSSFQQSVTIVAAQPALFFNAQTGTAAALISGTAQTTDDRPAAPGDYLELYATGLGADPTQVQVTIGGQPVPVLYAGRSSYPGLNQINVRLPSGLPGGAVSVVLISGGQASPPVPIRLRP